VRGHNAPTYFTITSDLKREQPAMTASGHTKATNMPTTNKKLALIAMICAVSMTFIDQTIVSIAIPDIQQDLHLSESGVQWIINGYLVALAALFALGGRVSDIFGHKRVVLIGVVIFAFASAMCGATPSGSWAEAWMIVWRVVQGAGAAFMFPAALAIVVSAYPREERGKAMAAFFGIAGGMTALGPLVGGYLIEYSWRAIFWIKIPVAIAAVFLTLKANPDNTKRPAPLDIKGAVLAAVGIGSLVLGLQQASVWGWTSTATIGCILIGLAAIALFVRVELHTEHPLMQVRIFSNGAFTTDALILFLISIAFVPMFLFASMYSQISRGFTASQAGLYIGIYFLGFIAAAQYGGRMLDKAGARLPVLIGCAVATIGFVLWAQSMTDLSGGDYSQWWRMVIAGAGMGLVLGPISTDALNRAPSTSYGEVTGITQTSRNIGASVGIAVLGTIMIAQNKVNIEDAFAKLGLSKSQADAVADSMTQQGGSAGGSGGGGAKAHQIMDAVQSSFAQTTQTVFYGMAAAMALAFIVTLVRLPKGKAPAAEILD
jgi:EmrB/QacA subfamily drug resistance transporter